LKRAFSKSKSKGKSSGGLIKAETTHNQINLLDVHHSPFNDTASSIEKVGNGKFVPAISVPIAFCAEKTPMINFGHSGQMQKLPTPICAYSTQMS